MLKKIDKNEKRIKRHKRIRRKINGTADMPRLCVFKSARNMYVQLIDDTKGITLASASSLDKDIKSTGEYTGNKKTARNVGQLIAKRAIEKGIDTVVFDRGGYIYHGRVKEVAEGARESGLKF